MQKNDFYKEKKALLERLYGYNSVNPLDFYRDMFPVGSFERKGHPEEAKANGILCSIKGDKGRHSLVFDELDEIKNHLDDEFVIISPIAYFGQRRSAKNASMLYGICFDLDEVGIQELSALLFDFDSPNFPTATYIANSGNGMHIYYLLKHPIPLYKSIHKRLNALKHDLTKLIWNKYTSQIDPKNRQYQGIFQGFRMVGSKTKTSKNRIKVYKTGEKVDIEYLNQFVAPEYRVSSVEYESSLSLDKAKEKYPQWYQKRVIEGQRLGRWVVKRDLYDWWLKKIQTDSDLKVGHRYFCICVLACYARKCNISEDELRKDTYGLLDFMNTFSPADFTCDDIEAALNFYQESYITFPRDEIKKISGLDMPTNKRNGRKQEQHLARARAVQRFDDEENGTNWREGNGRPKGSPNKEHPKRDLVLSYKKEHPNASQREIAKALGISPTTVNKWLKEF